MHSDNKRYEWLKENFPTEFEGREITEEIFSNTQVLAQILKEKGFLVQILHEVNEPFVGSWRNSYQVNVYFSLEQSQRLDLIDKVYKYFKYTLAGTDAGNMGYNMHQSEYSHFFFKLLVQEGV
jgi:hypothetical protein